MQAGEEDHVYEGDWRLLDRDPETGVTRWWLDMGDHYIVRTDTPVQPLLDENARDLSNSAGRRWGDGQRVASIPLDVYYRELHAAQMQKDEKYLRKWLNNADNSKFRTFGGKV